jgi:hypothetical protein
LRLDREVRAMSTRTDMTARGAAYTALCAELRRQGPLWPAERELLLEAADALLFDEPEAAPRRAEALELLNMLVANERRTEAEATRLSTALTGCAAPVTTVALLPAPPAAGAPAGPVATEGATHAA